MLYMYKRCTRICTYLLEIVFTVLVGWVKLYQGPLLFTRLFEVKQLRSNHIADYYTDEITYPYSAYDGGLANTSYCESPWDCLGSYGIWFPTGRIEQAFAYKIRRM